MLQVVRLAARLVSHRSGLMFVTALLVSRSRSPTSNCGDKGQDIITMTDERACLPLYLIQTRFAGNPLAGMPAAAGWGQDEDPGVEPFSGEGTRLGGRTLAD